MTAISGDFSFSLDMNAAPRPRHDAGARYVALPFEARVAGDEVLVRIGGGNATVRIPLLQAQVLGVCDRLRTLDAHRQRALAALQLSPDRSSSVQRALEQLVRMKLLRDEASVFETIAHGGESELPPRMRRFFIRTCDRPDELCRLLDELAPLARAAALETVFVLDDSRSEAHAAANARAVSDSGLADGVETIVIDRARRQQIVRAIADRAGADRDALEWMIEGDRDDPAPSYGANLNLALLLGAGERLVMIEDDAGLTAHAPEPPRPGLSLRPAFEPTTRPLDPGHDELAAFGPVTVNPLLDHARILGRSVAALATDFGNPDGRLLDWITPGKLHEIQGNPRVRLTTNGTLGDCGNKTPAWLFAKAHRALLEDCRDETDYRRIAMGRRVARWSDDIQVAGGDALMTTTLTGIDNRALLMPTQARGRGEDVLFGALVEFLYPGSQSALLPWMLRHRIEPQPPWRPDDLARGRRPEPTVWLTDRIDDLGQRNMGGSPEHRTELLGDWLRAIAKTDEKESADSLRDHFEQHRAQFASSAKQALQELDPPDWMRRDFETVIAANLRAESRDAEDCQRAATTVGRFARSYSSALGAWCIAWRWCAEHPVDTLINQAD